MSDDDTNATSGDKDQLPAEVHKSTFLEWLEGYLPFSLPRIALPQTAKNIDQAAAKLVLSSGNNLVARVEASTERRRAISRGELSFIERGVAEISNAKVDGIEDRALKYVLNKAKVEQENREDILELAFEDLANEPPQADAASNMSDDWLNLFAKIASDKTEDDIQILFAKILAGEIRQPGKTKLSILSQLATLDKDDASFSYKFLQNVYNNEFLYQAFYSKGQAYVDLLRARELALVSGDSSITLDLNETSHFPLSLGKKLIIAKPTGATVVQMPALLLTRFGSALFNLIKDQSPDEDYIESIVSYFKKQNFIVQVHLMP